MTAIFLLRRFWWAVPLLGLSLALLVTRATLARVKYQRDAAAMKLDVTAASLDRVSAEMKRVMGEAQELAAGDRARIDASRDALRAAQAAEKARQTNIDRLTRSAADRSSAPDCQASVAVSEVWK